MTRIPKISDAEWLIMKLLWKKSPKSANAIVEALEGATTWNHRTIKTLINRLVKKKAIGFEKDGRAHLYFPLVEEKEIIKKESRHFLKRFFGGTLSPMLAHLVDSKELSDKEIRELMDILNKAGKD